jgi:nucleotide-binding universal stress UspA family protein
MNPIRVILVHLDDSPGCATRLQTAHALAVQHGATVQALFAATPMMSLAPFAFPDGAEYAARMAEFDRERRASVRALFDAHAGSDGRMQWQDGEGEAIWAVSQAALCADLLVLGQRDPAAAAQVPLGFVESVLIGSGKPALVLPYISSGAAAHHRVALVAWKNSRESARAMSDALPLLARAEQVHVARWQEDDESGGPDPLAFLQRHGIRALHHAAGKPTHELGEQLLSLASDLGAELLVMGCYGHSRAREWVLGGASYSVLRAMTLPVLMAH